METTSTNSAAYEMGQKFGVIIGGVLGLAIIALFIVSLVKIFLSPPGRRTGWMVGLAISGVLLALVAFSVVKGMGKVAAALAVPTKWREVSTKDPVFTVQVPESWSELTQLPETKVRMGNLVAEQYFVALSESKAELGMNLQEVDEATFEQISGEGSVLGKPGKPESTTIGGLPALVRHFDMTLGRLQVTYLRSVVESKAHFHYLSFWTLKSRADKHIPIFEKVLNSLKVAEGPPVAEEEPQMVPVKDAAAKVLKLVSEQLGNKHPVTAETSLKDLGADDLDNVELIMALEEAFNLSIADEAAEQFASVGDLISFVEANARVPANLPEVPSHFPKSALLQPSFHGGTGRKFAAGSAFLCAVSADQTLLLTAQHLFGEAGGLEKDLPWKSMAREYPNATATLNGTEDVGAEGTEILLLPNARGMNDKTCALDLAAFKIAPGASADSLPLAAKNPKEGDIVFLNSAYIGWTPAVVVGIDKNKVTYRFHLPNVQLPGTSGAPLVNVQGEVVGIHLGGRSGRVAIGIGNPCESMRALLEKAKP